MNTFEITISGSRVHGVGFRRFVKDKATILNLTGYVKNTYDGKVLAVVQGEKDAVETLIKYCRTGPRLADVDSVDFQGVSECDFLQFEIR
ncbi:MAG: acylphosphatase [Bacteroidales bacterium]|nr:acylphosphatase [Bacteroidales bacterium]